MGVLGRAGALPVAAGAPHLLHGGLRVDDAQQHLAQQVQHTVAHTHSLAHRRNLHVYNTCVLRNDRTRVFVVVAGVDGDHPRIKRKARSRLCRCHEGATTT